MFKKFRIFHFTLILFGVMFLLAFESDAQIETADSENFSYLEDEDDDKTPGATVRGRVVYDDTDRPVRYLVVTLVSADNDASMYSDKYVKTDENGEFVLENVKAGSHYLYVKNKGFLNPDFYREFEDDEKTEIFESLFQKVSVSGTGVFNFQFRVKRGGAVSGVVRYADGEVATDVKVEVLRKKGDKFSAYPISGLADVGKTKTDDRGFYRFAGLPEGKYIVRVIEPVSHTAEKITYNEFSNYYSDYDDKEYLKTYYPNGETSKDASEVGIFFGQEQTAVDITIPKRQLFNIYGKVVLKKTGEILENFEISFYKLDDVDTGLDYGGPKIATFSVATLKKEEIPGEWVLRNLPKGKYRIDASQVSLYGEKGKNQPKYPDVSKEVEIIDGNIENFVLEVPPGGSIKGFIYEQNGKNLPEGMSFFVWNENAENLRQAEVDYSGYKKNDPASQKQLPFEVNQLTAGEISISDFGEEFYIKKLIVGGRESADLQIDLQEGENLEGVQIVIGTNMGTLKGKVANAEKAREVAVYLIKKEFGAEPEIAFGDIAEKDGSYQFKAAPGEYFVIVRDQSNDDENSEEEHQNILRKLLKNAPTVTVREYQTTTMNLEMPKQ